MAYSFRHWLLLFDVAESAVSLHSIYSYFKMVSQSISRNYQARLPTENNEQEVMTAQSLQPISVTTNLFLPKVDEIHLTKRCK